MNHYYPLKETLEYYKSREITNVVICFADPITGWIKNEVKDLKTEDFLETEVGKHQIRVHIEEDEKTLLVLLAKKQLLTVYPDAMERLIDTKYAVKPPMEFKMFDHTISTKIPIGYCHNCSHKGLVSTNMLNQRKCVSKQCPYLERYEEHSYWVQRRLLKENKKRKKQQII